MIREEFNIVDERCYFCGHESVVKFKEHYKFCPACTAISTDVIAKTKCIHFNNNSMMIAIREPLFSTIRNKKPYVIGDESEGMGPCSICGKLCEADGW